MHRYLRFMSLALCLGCLTMVSQAQLTEAPIQGVMRVKLQPEVATRLSAAAPTGRLKARSTGFYSGIQPLDASLQKLKTTAVQRVFPCSPEREAEHAKFGLNLWYEITFDTEYDLGEARRVLFETPGVSVASMRRPARLLDDDGQYHKLAPEQMRRAATPGMPFNDPRLDMQWHYHNSGSITGTRPGADINLFEAWKECTGSRDVIVAIVDGGVDYTHEDLADAMWVNQAELNGRPGVDDDGNGYVDDVYGYNFCTNNGTIYPHHHGTHVAGTVGAVNNNGKGVCGVAGGNNGKGGVRLMSCQVFDSRSGAPQGDFAAAIVFAADNGASIVQCSWGWQTPDYYEPDVVDAIRYFTASARSNKMAGGLCIFASGNDSSTGNIYPGCMEEVISVAAMTADLQPAFYSNYGEWVDVIAPGGNIDIAEEQAVLSTLPDNAYGYKDGTSMAAPHVSGIAALILSKHGSATLINESVRHQIVTSVNDFYTYNSLVEGLYGSGYVDAWKALQWGDGTAPEAVADLAADPSQDAVMLRWTIPASSDNNVNSHIIYYSDAPFTADDLSGCRSVVVDTKFYKSGDPFEYEIGSLSAMTTYYFAVRAMDRWGNASPLSTLISTTTNAGPKMELSRASMTLATSDGEKWNSSSFVISNKAEGLLRWSTRLRTAQSTIQAFSLSDKGLLSKPYAGRLTIEPAEKKPGMTDVEEFVQEDYPKQMQHFDMLLSYVGEEDQSTTNSMAQLFTVSPDEFPDGFNLTHVNLFGAYGRTPLIEVYRGGSTLSPDNLLESVQTSSNYSAYYYDHQLTEALYFAPGESFYIVVHFKDFTNRNYPLGLAISNGHKDAALAYISNDWGKTWTLLSQALKDSPSYAYMAEEGTWAITVKSKFPDWSKVLVLTPEQGQIRGGGNETQTVRVSYGDTKIPNGVYRARIYFDTNETEPSNASINVNLSVEGHKPDVTYNKIVQFGNLLVGQKKTISIEVSNRGYGSFSGGATYAGLYGENISSTCEHFHGPAYMQNGIPARSSEIIELTYEPKAAGSHSGCVVLTDKDGYQLRINVQGAATEPAKLVARPATINVGQLDASGEPREVEFDIANEGNFPLQFVMPKFTDETLEEEGESHVHRFGYAWTSNLYGSRAVEYDGRPQLIDAVDVSSDFSDYVYFSRPIDIGFSFPFYGRTYDRLYISSLGLITFDQYTEGLIYSPVRENTTSYLQGLGVISAYGFQFQIGPQSHVEYAKADGNLVINFRDVLVTVYDIDYIPASFHVILSPSGDIRISFDDYNHEAVFEQGHSLWVGIVDPEMVDPLTVTSGSMTTGAYFYDDQTPENNRWRHIATGSSFVFSAPKPDMIRSISPTSGIVSPGEAMHIKATVAATDDMYAGPTYTNLVVLSNDIANPTSLVRFEAEITGDLRPEFSLAADAVDFGDVFRTSVAKQAVTVHNRGRNTMTLQSVSIAGGRFSHDFTEPVQIAAGQSKDVLVTLPTTNEGTVADKMTITTSAGSRTIDLKGRVIGVPQIKIGYEKLALTLESGESSDQPLVIANEGNEPLIYSILPGAHVNFTPDYEPGSDVSYTYSASVDDPTAARDWIDIETNGLGRQLNYTYYLGHDYVAVDLPFEFPFCNKKYTRMYVYNVGFVSFTERTDEAIWPEPPGEFPDGSIHNNLIAPFWGLHSMDMTATAGTYHWVDADKAVISFIEYGNSMNVGVDFQLVIRSDGTFTFNYRAANEYAIIFAPFGVMGYSDEYGKGIRLPDRYLAFGNTVNFYPVVKSTVAPGEQRTAKINVVADRLAGSYAGNINIATNQPGSESIDIPVKLTITGTPEPVWPADLTIEHPMEYADADPRDPLAAACAAFWYEPISIANTGKAAFTISDISMECPRYEGSKMFTLYYYGKYTDAWMGTETVGWCPYTSGTPIEVGTSPLRLAVPVCGADLSQVAWQTPGTYDIKLTLRIKGITGLSTKTINLKYIITEQPNAATAESELRINNADDNAELTEYFTLTNTGKYRLDYTLRVDATGEGEKAPEYDLGVGDDFDDRPTDYSRSGEAPSAMILPKASLGTGKSTLDVGNSEFVFDCPSDMDFEYNRAMYWPAMPGSGAAFNYGSSTTYGLYKAATAFVGPKGGFNISHIYTAMLANGLDNKDVVIEIYNGDPQKTNDIIGRCIYPLGEISKTDDPTVNIRFIAELDRPVFVSEGQVIYVVITYPVGQPYPATLTYKQDGVVSNRYLGFWDTFGWFDVGSLFNETYGSLGYLCTCLETVEGDAWIKILNPDGSVSSEAEGSIAAGAETKVNLRLRAADAPREADNKAVVVIKSNDPKAQIINFPVYLSKNSRPSIKIASTESIISAAEGAVTTIKVNVIDPEGDDFSVSIYDNGATARIAAVDTDGQATIADDGLSVEIKTSANGAEITIELKPDYGDAGSYAANITATDAAGHEAYSAFNYMVEHVNRAPVASQTPTVNVPIGQASLPFDLNTMFSDPDGDLLTYTVKISSGQNYTLYQAGNNVIFTTSGRGTGLVSITATDPDGLSARGTMILNATSGIDDLRVDAALDIYPNPVAETLYVSIDQADEIACTLYNATGAVAAARRAHVAQGQALDLAVAHLPAGIYVLHVSTSKGTFTQLVIKD